MFSDLLRAKQQSSGSDLMEKRPCVHKGLKGLRGERAGPLWVMCPGRKGPVCSQFRLDQQYEIKAAVIMQNLCRSQLMQASKCQLKTGRL